MATNRLILSGSGFRHKAWRWSFIALALYFASWSAIAASKVVYHVGDDLTQGRRALLFIRNHLSVMPDTEVVVVGHAGGVDFLLDDPERDDSYEFSLALRSLMRTGRVRFVACGITMASRRIPTSRLIQGVELVPSGVAEIARLQTVEHFAYIRP